MNIGYWIFIIEYSKPLKGSFVICLNATMKASIFYPGKATLQRFLQKQNNTSFTYRDLKGSLTGGIKGYDNDYNYKIIGQGDETWERAKKALRNWEQFPTLWTKIETDGSPPKTGQVVAVLFLVGGLWWLNSTRIVHTFDETRRFGIAYGTLQGHIESGEECFWIERDKKGVITYHMRAFSKPYYWFVKLAYPLARFFQRQFVLQSMEQMKKLCSHLKK